MNIQPWLRRMMIQLVPAARLAPEEEPNSGPDEDSSVHESEVDLDNKDKYLSKGDLEEGSEKDEEQDQYTSGSCKQTLAKVNNQIWQCHKRHGVERKYHLDDSDFDLARDLVQVLQLFYEITLQVSIASSAQVLNIVIFIDQITDHLSTVTMATTK
ncbi:hypothetical protein H4Q26_017567 [Puccinia striiformis f. sp. tritici PST-130]|nr:hypothetical protein H4Q26_017567 [Puccinia striiformis f. sp. tritici PST-130]